MIEDEYIARTPASASMMGRAARSMPRGLTRSLSWFAPYPVVFESGAGARLVDLDGHEYVDLFSNGLSLMHGHSYGPIDAVLTEALGRGTAWPGTSDAQVEFAEILRGRLPGVEQVRFTNTGTEATMLAVKLARHLSGRELVIKAWDAYHGSFSDLEAGLEGQGEMPGRAALATFGDLASYERLLAEHPEEVAAVIVEPVQYTGVVTPPRDGFLAELQALARDAGILFIIDDCLMFRLAEGGSVERFGLAPADITCLGKWIGGGLPVGAIGASAQLMSTFDLDPEHPLYHGGSFNGNLLGMAAGTVAVRDLTADAIRRIDGQGDALREDLQAFAEETGIAIRTSGIGSAFGLYVLDREGRTTDSVASAELHLASVNRGVYYGAGGEFGLSTVLSDADLEFTRQALRAAMGDLAAVARSSA